ncbi:uncharacterized protein MELLADRAFT_114155 [Melampsora larici-populina 98AG31]|uniref:RING-type domain-containing protein n=1 Tax=Melampsora larici-populina (strain 98AG31 / pathotype 3-4-7) TaxID=747676 RepID=F4SCE6_MELLP|nr:uncharacterized protein MELLADRAFT_114155 [Melampsora larici-populina 98AG31]EGF97690.1 hypothetical protein MELLADRAFT_114155 [Melampsora larici-populina 98AG31]
MSFLEYDLSSLISTFNRDLLHLHSSNESYTNQELNTDSGMLEDFQLVSLFNTIWNLFKTNNNKPNSNSVLSSTTTTSNLLSLATTIRLQTDLRELTSNFINLQQYSDLSTFDPPLELVLKPVATPITSFEDTHKLSTPVGSPSITLPRIDLTTVRSNDTLGHTFPVGFRATFGGAHHLGNVHILIVIHNQLNSQSKKTCAICMDSVNDQADLIKLSRTHFFHAKSRIIPWIQRNPSCPVCQYKLVDIDLLFRENNSRLPDHLYQAYYESLFKNHHLSAQSNPSTYPRQNSNDQAVVMPTIWDSHSRFMM